MKWLFTTLSIGSVSFCLMAASGCSNEARNSETEHNNNVSGALEAQDPDQFDAAVPSEESRLVNTNWSLEGDPGAVRLHQRIDPVTGRKFVLSEEQSAMTEDDGQSVLERQAAKKHQAARGRQTTFGDPTGNVQAVR